MSALTRGPQAPATTPLSIFRPDPSHDEPGQDVTSPSTATLPTIIPMTALATTDIVTQDTSVLFDGLSIITEVVVPALPQTASPVVRAKTAAPRDWNFYRKQQIDDARLFVEMNYGLEIPRRHNESLPDEMNRCQAIEFTLTWIGEKVDNEGDRMRLYKSVVSMSFAGLRTFRYCLKSRLPIIATRLYLAEKHKLTEEIPTVANESPLAEFLRLRAIEEALGLALFAYMDGGWGLQGTIIRMSLEQLTTFIGNFNVNL